MFAFHKDYKLSVFAYSEVGMKMLKIAVLLLTLIAGATFASADEYAAPQGEVILTVSGDIAQTNVNDTLQFDYEMLGALDDTIIETSTIWTDGVRRFQGVSLNVLIDLLDVKDGSLRATAINDYAVQIPVSDATPDGPILAYLVDDQKMSVREKGPLWVIYPYDRGPEFRSEVIFSRSIWQLDRIEVVK